MTQMTLKVKVNDFHFQYQPKVSHGCMFGANLVILAQICDELWREQAEFARILSQNCQNNLEGQGQWPVFSIPAESIPGRMFGANLVIPSQPCDDKVKFMDGRTDADNNNAPSAWKAKG